MNYFPFFWGLPGVEDPHLIARIGAPHQRRTISRQHVAQGLPNRACCARSGNQTIDDLRATRERTADLHKPGLCQGALGRSISVQELKGRCPLIEQRLRGALPSKAYGSETRQIHAIPAKTEHPLFQCTTCPADIHLNCENWLNSSTKRSRDCHRDGVQVTCVTSRRSMAQPRFAKNSIRGATATVPPTAQVAKMSPETPEEPSVSGIPEPAQALREQSREADRWIERRGRCDQHYTG